MKICLIIPVYRHVQPLLSVLKQLEGYGLPCLLIDDFNQPPLKEALAAIGTIPSWVTFFRLGEHGGKGMATLEGCRRAFEQGYTHAIFLDADDQHNTQDIPRVLDLVRANPSAMVLGCPQFDGSAPFKRRIGRILSNVWVWIETLSLDIRDSLCGFHGFPLKPVLDIASKVRLGKGMDFDPDIVVRLYWAGVPVVSFDTQIKYPSQGHSNFRLVKDNAVLFCLHTRLVIGMLWRWPGLLWARSR